MQLLTQGFGQVRSRFKLVIHYLVVDLQCHVNGYGALLAAMLNEKLYLSTILNKPRKGCYQLCKKPV